VELQRSTYVSAGAGNAVLSSCSDTDRAKVGSTPRSDGLAVVCGDPAPLEISVDFLGVPATGPSQGGL
jgi:hypothetical protein